MFAELRDAVKQFLSKVNVETAAKAVQATQEMLKGAITACPAPGQKLDMAHFAQELQDHIDDAYEKMVSAHDKFIAAHKAIFFGTVSHQTMKILLNRERWKKSLHDVRISQLNSALRRLYEHEYIAVSLRNYDGEFKSGLKDHLRRTVGELYEDIERQAKLLSVLPNKLEDAMDKIEGLGNRVD
jgi:DNA repair exonuclease SbcCD ATPase subunit